MNIMSIHQTIEYQEIWNCKGYSPLNLEKAKGRILYRFGIPYKTIFGGMGGSGILEYNDDVIKEILNKSKGVILIYDFKEQPILEKFGFKKNDDWTFILDIKNIEELWKKMKSGNQRAIRFAEKSGIIFDEIKSENELDKVYGLLKEHSNRRGFRIPKKDYIENIWNFMVKKNMAKFFAAFYNNEMISVAQIFIYNDEISMPLFGNNERAKEFKANNFLTWKILEWGNKHGYKKFNFWGTDPNPDSPLYGIHKFKESFGGELVKVYRYEKSNFVYNLIKKLMRR